MPRILCLHGSGSSAEILKSQTASIRSLLPATYTFVFIDAPIKCRATPELKMLYPGPYYQFFERYSDVDMQKAINAMEEVVEEEGPYDGVLGFSQGASVAAACIAQQQLGGSFEEAPFKMAIFFCAALIPPEIATDGEMANAMGTLCQIDIPTVHIIGKKDLCEAQSLELVKSCKRNIAKVLLIDGGHDIPRDVVNAKKIAVAIERALVVAFSG